MRSQNFILASFIVGGLTLSGSTALMPVHQACAAQATMSYSQDIAPIFRGWCVSCHHAGGEGFEKSGFDLSTYDGLMKGTKFGPMIIPGKPDISNLILLIDGRASPEIRMPFQHKPLPNCLRENIWSWIFEGAKDN